MDVIAIATVSGTIAAWTNALIIAGFVFSGAAVSVVILDRVRRFLYQAALDAIQVYAAFEQSRLDIQTQQQKLLAQSEEARLLLRQQRYQLLERLED